MMKKYFTYVFLLIIILLNMINPSFAGSPNNLEKADVLYRGLQIGGWVDWHTGIYMYYAGGNASEDTQHILGEQLPPVTMNTLYDFKSRANYEGARTLNCTVAQRKGIIETIKTNPNIDVPFVDFPAWSKMIRWTDENGDGKLQDTEIDQLRCDGWTEVVYALNGVQIQDDIINNTNTYNITTLTIIGYVTVRSPKTQASAMMPATGTPPVLTVTDSQNNSIPDNGTTTDKNISVKVNDGTNGSGVCHFEVYQGADVNGTPLSSYWDDTYYDTQSHTYTLNNLPDGQICIRAFDQAGNDTLHHKNIASNNFPVPVNKLTISNIC